MPAIGQFVLLRHETPPGYPRPTHWDFMIEVAGALRTWALEEAPADGRLIAAEALADHRLAYLELEGEISGGRGTVARCDRGSYSVARESNDELLLELHGEQLVGRVLLTRNQIASQTTESNEPQRWKFKFTSARSAIGSPDARGAELGE